MSTRTSPETAGGITAEKLAEYRSTWRQIEIQKRQERLERHARAMQAAQAAAQALRERFGAQRVRAFGSVLYPETFHKRSDIDLAVEGIEPMQLLKAWCAASAVTSEFEFDLVTPEESRPEIWAAAEAQGVDL